MTRFNTLSLLAFVAALLAGCSYNSDRIHGPSGVHYEQTPEGVLVYPKAGETKSLRIQVIDENILRVTSTPQDKINEPDSLMVTRAPKKTPFSISASESAVSLKTSKIAARVSITDGNIKFTNSHGEVLETVNSGRFKPAHSVASDDASNRYSVSQSFRSDKDDAFYGLGQQQNGKVNLAGENLYLTTYNLIITIPYLTSSRNFGILWDNNSDSRFGSPSAPKPLFENFQLFALSGKPGALTARYFDGDTLLLEREEKDLNYQFLSNNSIREIPLPEQAENARDLRIEWLGSVSSHSDGEHELLMYSSGYAQLYVQGKKLLDRWRMNWNPWYHPVRVRFQAGEKQAIKLQWQPQGGYMRLLSHAPTPEMRKERITLSSEIAGAIDYYVVSGANKDELVSGYRQLTGKSVLLPRWAYGFWQSRERYKSSDELLNTLREYRRREIPIDNIVLDWSYWPVDAWGSHDFDPAFFPEPEKMVEQVHNLNARIMISVWPKFYPTTDNYKALNAQGFMLNRNLEEGNRDWISPGYPNAFYDAFNPQARQLFWKQLHEKINTKGFDAWWLDAVEPDIHSNVNWDKRKALISPNYLGSGADVFNAYSLPHAESVYQGDRNSAPDTRVFILTRSGFAGIQRTAAAIWSGDTVSRWSNLYEQIAAGINTGMAGMPNWTLDIGGFTPEDRFRSYNGAFVGPYTSMSPEQLPEWQELNTRWYQFGAFLPIYRSHGQNPYREIFNIAEEGSAAYNSMVWYTKLRYRLLPYIYSLAGDMYHRDATLMRGLAMDFPKDKQAASINDQYMFGPAFLVAPVYEYQSRERQVYLPSGADWYDFYTARFHKGGQILNAPAPLGRMPLFVKAGSIVVTGPNAQYAAQSANKDLTVTVFTGADGQFELYEDDGSSYDYEQGAWTRIPLTFDNHLKELVIGERIGEFASMAKARKIHIRWVSQEQNYSSEFDHNLSTTVQYKGLPLSVIQP